VSSRRLWQLYKVAGDYSRKINSVDVTRGTFVISLVILSVNGDDAVHTIKDGVIIKSRHGWTTVIVVCAIILLGEVIVQWGLAAGESCRGKNPLDLDEMRSCAASYHHGLRMPSNMIYGGRYGSAA